MQHWTVVFQDVARGHMDRTTVVVPVEAEAADEAIRLARLNALEHFSVDQINAANKIEARPWPTTWRMWNPTLKT